MREFGSSTRESPGGELMSTFNLIQCPITKGLTGRLGEAPANHLGEGLRVAYYCGGWASFFVPFVLRSCGVASASCIQPWRFPARSRSWPNRRRPTRPDSPCHPVALGDGVILARTASLCYLIQPGVDFRQPLMFSVHSWPESMVLVRTRLLCIPGHGRTAVSGHQSSTSIFASDCLSSFVDTSHSKSTPRWYAYTGIRAVDSISHCGMYPAMTDLTCCNMIQCMQALYVMVQSIRRISGNRVCCSRQHTTKLQEVMLCSA